MMNIGVISCGGAGENILRKMRRTYCINRCMSINTNIGDMKDISIPQFIVPGAAGVAKDRELAKKLFTDEVKEEFLKEVDTIFEDTDFIYLIANGGGGSGSGIIPIVSKLIKEKYPDKVICSVIGMPSMRSSSRELRNGAKCFIDVAKNMTNSFKVFKSEEPLEETDAKLIETLMYPFLPRESVRETVDESEIRATYNKIGLITPSMLNSKSEKINDIFVAFKGKTVTTIFADNLEMPSIEGIPGMVFKGDYVTTLPKRIFKLEAGQPLDVKYFQNLKAHIVKKEEKEKEIKEEVKIMDGSVAAAEAIEF